MLLRHEAVFMNAGSSSSAQNPSGLVIDHAEVHGADPYHFQSGRYTSVPFDYSVIVSVSSGWKTAPVFSATSQGILHLLPSTTGRCDQSRRVCDALSVGDQAIVDQPGPTVSNSRVSNRKPAAEPPVDDLRPSSSRTSHPGVSKSERSSSFVRFPFSLPLVEVRRKLGFVLVSLDPALCGGFSIEAIATFTSSNSEVVTTY